MLETSGAVDTSAVDARVRIILDIKTPGSGEVDANVWSNLDRLKPTDEVKFVVCDRDDFDWSADVIRSHRLDGDLPGPRQRGVRPGQSDRAGRLILESGLPVRLQLQQHKILWDPAARGV